MKWIKNKPKKNGQRILGSPLLRLAIVLDSLSVIFALLVGGCTYRMTPPESTALWIFKATEFAGAGFGAGGIWASVWVSIKDVIKKKRIERAKRMLDKRAKSEDITVEHLISRDMKRITRSIRKLAKDLGINVRPTRHSAHRYIVSFTNSLIDEIEINMREWHFRFRIRFYQEEDMLRVLELSPGLTPKIIMVGDEQNLECTQRYRITVRGVRKLKATLLIQVIFPAYLLAESFLD